ncbi:MAG: serine/threonine-protein phosphatase [Coleofasciculaceae cyanobacterium RL_1_1]|nr:serine/threonine-protein phosphatase [Coleofasciculaceae cyanobacterium RL_1_1]
MTPLDDHLSSVKLVRYLWAIGSHVENAEIGTTIADRYQVIAPRIWIDRHLDRVPAAPQTLPPESLIYLKQIRQPLHIPQVYGFCDGRAQGMGDIMLLENVPIDEHGQLYPTIEAMWSRAKSVRRAYWLAQILDLWQILEPQKLAASLLDPDNIRVQGWRVWLLELKPTIGKPSLIDLAYHWRRWLDRADANDPTPAQLLDLCQQIRSQVSDIDTIRDQLDRILLEAAARQPLRLSSFGISDSGPSRLQNEDSCYPIAEDMGSAGERRGIDQANLAILCDGVGGHEGGDVASQLAVKTLKLQVEAFRNIIQTKSFVPAAVICQQLATMVRVTNNTIAQENDARDRLDRERMATTAVMAWQVAQAPPPLKTSKVVSITTASRTEPPSDHLSDRPNAHELFIASVGDSRAYWISEHYCQQLTVDDDLATQEVAAGNCLYREAIQYEEAAALTQAIGTRDGTMITPDVRRIVIEEDGVLLLCSDGVSDNNWVEKSWKAFVPPLLEGLTTLEATARDWLEVTNDHNGHDNATIVLIDCRVSEPAPSPLEIFDPKANDRDRLPTPDRTTSETIAPFDRLTESSRALLSIPANPEPTRSEPPRRRRPKPTRSQQLGVAIAIAILASLGVLAQS